MRQLAIFEISNPKGTPITVPILIPATVKATAFPLWDDDTSWLLELIAIGENTPAPNPAIDLEKI